MWRHYDVIYAKNGKYSKKRESCLDHEFIGTFGFHPVCDKNYLRWIGKRKTV